MGVLNPNNPSDSYRKAAEDRYWRILKETLRHVFGADPALADEYRRSLSDASPEEHTLAYHAEPLDVAADLTDSHVTAEHVSIYQKLLRDVFEFAVRPS